MDLTFTGVATGLIALAGIMIGTIIVRTGPRRVELAALAIIVVGIVGVMAAGATTV